MPTIEIDHLTKDYGNKKGVFDVSFSVNRGEVFGFLGPNGAGKTTTIRHLMGFSNPDHGTCKIDHMDCRKETGLIQKNLGYIPGEIAFMDHMTGLKFLQFIANYRGLSSMKKAEALLKRFELDPKGKMKRMSKGMKQKIGIICAFMHDPNVLLLDEPTSGLDPLMQNRFIELILEEKEQGKTILMSSHIFEEIERTCSRVAIIRSGHIVATDKIETLKESKTKRYIIHFEDESAVASFMKESFPVESTEGTRVTLVITKEHLSPLISCLSRYPLTSLDTAAQSLEEVFMHYYGGEHL